MVERQTSGNQIRAASGNMTEFGSTHDAAQIGMLARHVPIMIPATRLPTTCISDSYFAYLISRSGARLDRIWPAF